jgi:hypothetical protein
VRSNALVVAASLASLALLSCGKEVGRIPFHGEGAASTSVPLSSGEVSFWTDIDVEYPGDTAFAYTIELHQGATKVATATCNPLGQIQVKTNWVETHFGGSNSRRGEGKMTCSASVPAGGTTVVNATLAYSHKPATVSLRKADLVIKQ